MGKQKRLRKIKSANKLLRQQRKVSDAMTNIKLATLTSAFTCTVACIRSAKYIKAGDKEEAIKCLTEQEIVLPEKSGVFKISHENGVNSLKETKINVDTNFFNKEEATKYIQLLKEKINEQN